MPLFAIIAGWFNRLGRNRVKVLLGFFLAGDPTDEALVLKCELHRATRALIACDAEADTLVIAVAIHSITPELEVSH